MTGKKEGKQGRARDSVNFSGLPDDRYRHRVLRIRILVFAIVNQQGNAGIDTQIGELSGCPVGQYDNLPHILRSNEGHQTGKRLAAVVGCQHCVALRLKKITKNKLKRLGIGHRIPFMKKFSQHADWLMESPVIQAGSTVRILDPA